MDSSRNQTILVRGNRLLRAGRFDAAIQLYKEALTLEGPLRSQLEKNIALAELRKKIYGPSVEDGDVNNQNLRWKKIAQEKQSPDQVNIDIVIPVYNALDYVKVCLKEIERNRDDLKVNIIIVNDGSDRDATTWLRETAGRQEDWTLVEHEKNLGYTKAVNTGLRASRGDYVVILNSDTIVTPGWLRGLLKCMLSDADIGLVGPLSNAASWQSVPEIKNSDGSLAINELPSGISPHLVSKLIALESRCDYPRVRFLNGFCLMVCRSVLDNVGFLDDVAFPRGYGEENDLCVRAYKCGFDLAIADDAFVFHAKSKSFGHESRNLLSKRGGENLRKKHGAQAIRAALEETEKSVHSLQYIRNAVNELFSSPQKVERLSGMRAPLEPIVLEPEPTFEEPGFNLEPAIDQPALVLPYSEKKVCFQGSSSNSVAVHLHLHYQKLLDEFLEHLECLPLKFDLFVSVTDARCKAAAKEKYSSLENAQMVRVEQFENRGRDIGPFVAGFGQVLKEYDLVCHIHSKRSPHNLAKRDWRRQLLHNLLGSPTTVSAILSFLHENKKVGLVFPKYHPSLKRQIGWGTNFKACKELARRLGVEITANKLALFPAGSMFWARGEAIAPLFNSGLTFNDFPKEAGQVDGTPAHAVERLLGKIAVSRGLEVVQVIAEKPYNLKYYYPKKWPYKPLRLPDFKKRRGVFGEWPKNYKSRVSVYTAITGGYEQPVVHEALDDWVEYVLFADKKLNDMGFWQVRNLPPLKGDALLRARLIKTSPERLFREKDFAIWIDGNVVIRKSLSGYIEQARSHPEIPVFGIPHPLRNCAYQEGQEIISCGKAPRELVNRQMNKYEKEGFPEGAGLIETNFLIFNLNHPRIGRFLAEWRHELKTETQRDQLSVNYVLWKLGLNWLPIMEDGKSVRDHGDFAYLGHGRNSGVDYSYIPEFKS